MRIPITMCHGINPKGDFPLTHEHFGALISIARELDFTSINYNDLAAWREGQQELPDRPIMFDFDHPVKSMRGDIHDVLSNNEYTGNLFINTGMMDPQSTCYDPGTMTWDEVRELVDLGWHMGAHTVTHPNLSKLFEQDPSGEQLARELEECDQKLQSELGIEPQDFAFTGTSWSSAAEEQVKRRYRFGRLWIVGTEYQADGKTIRYADLVGVSGPDEPDGGPPAEARYITRDSHPYRLPSMEIQRALIYSPEAFRRYLEGALQP
ncbi:MAG: polysaccharide deacetylase family protein [bacterium]|nr:polysaccharide deacetylase family protein [bacterium]